MRVGIVGAGIAGLLAGRQLSASGHDVVLFDKGRSPGGRLATRRIGDATFDHGAQFFTVRSERFERVVEQWIADDVVVEWCRGFSEPDGHPRYVGRLGMNSIAKHLASGLDVRSASLVFSLHAGAGRHSWEVKLDDASTTAFDALVVTCPLPQTFSLLMSAEEQMPELLWRTDYDRTLALLTVLDRPSAVPAPGGVQRDATFTFVGDNQAKGISAAPAVTLHAGPAWSEAHWDDDPGTAREALLELARPWFGEAEVVEAQLKRWRFATPRSVWPDAHWAPEGRSDLVVAGDAFAGPRVEGAAISGMSAAEFLLS